MAQQIIANTIIPNFFLRDNLLPFQTAGTGMLLPKDSDPPTVPVYFDLQTDSYAEPMALMGVETDIIHAHGDPLGTNVLEIETDQALSILYAGQEAKVDFEFTMAMPGFTVPDTDPPGGIVFSGTTFGTGAKTFTFPMFLGVRNQESESSPSDIVRVWDRSTGYYDYKEFDHTVANAYENNGFYTGLYEAGVIHRSPAQLYYIVSRDDEAIGGVTRSAQIEVAVYPRLWRTTDKPTKTRLYNHIVIIGSWSIGIPAYVTYDSGIYGMSPVSYYSSLPFPVDRGFPGGISADEETENVFRLFEAGSAITPSISQNFWYDNDSDLDTEVTGSLDLRLISPRGTDNKNW